MALLASLFALLGRFVGRIVSTALSWASTLLFGRVPPERQLLLGVVTLGSLAWAITALGVLFPRVGAFLLTAVPLPDWVPSWIVRVAMLAAALLLPLMIGVLSRYLVEKARRPAGLAGLKGVLRGYPLAFVLSLVLVFVSVIAVLRRARTLAKRWTEAHIPVVVMPGGYEQVVRDLEDALDRAGVPVDRANASVALELPTRVVARVAGPGVQSLVPRHLLMLRARDLEVLVYPSDIAIAGTKAQVARARSATATRLTFSRAYLSSNPKTQAIEDLLAGVAGGRDLSAPAGRRRDGHGTAGEPPSDQDRAILAEVDAKLASLEVPFEQWEVVYRIRLQVERDLLRAGADPGAAAGGGTSDTQRGDGSAAARDGAAGRTAGPMALVAALVGIGLLAADVVLSLVEAFVPRLRRH